jgi:hypothetical protein
VRASDNTGAPTELTFSDAGEYKNARIEFNGNGISGDFLIQVLPWNDWI